MEVDAPAKNGEFRFDDPVTWEISDHLRTAD